MKKPFKYRRVLLWTMRITITQLMLAILFMGAGYAHNSLGQSLLSEKITVSANGSEIRKVLTQLEKQVDVRFVFSSTIIKSTRRVTVNANDRPLYEVLDQILTPLDLQYEISGKIIILKRLEGPGMEAPAEPKGVKRQVSGKISDENNQPLPGVSVVIKGTQTGTTTNVEGVFQLNVESDDAVLVLSFVGYVTKEVPVGSQSAINVTMAPEDQSLQEVVVVGYGQVKKSDLTGSVSTIPVDEIKKVAVTSMDQALQGRAAGVQITQNSGAPGGATTIRIRGGNSIQGDNEPLYVIDGIPFKNDVSNSGSNFNVLSTLNPSDIESMTILKDASSTAIYGSRGANGVVIITTKRGKAGRSTVTLDAFYGVQTVRRKYPVLNAREYAQFVNDANTNEGRNPVYTPQQVEAFGEGTDWQEEIFRSAPTYNYQLSMSGGDDKTQYALSGGYYKQEGIVTNSDFDRYSFRVNLDRKLTNKIKVGNSLTVNRTVTNQSRTDGDLGSAGLVTMAALQFPSILPVYNPDGSYLMNHPALTFTADNPAALARESKNTNTAYRVFGNIFGEYQIIEGLNLRVVLGIDGIMQKQDSYLPRSVSSGLSQGGVGRVNNGQSITWLNENLLTYTKNFNKLHNLTLLVGYTQQANRTENSSAASRNFVNDNLGTGNIGSGSVALIPSSGIGTWGLESYLGRVNYEFNEKYLLTASFRADGSSRFGANKRYGFFPSLALAWRASEEPFIKNIQSISELKVRATIGSTGNQDGIGNYPAYSLLGTQNYVFGNNVSTGIGPNQIANPDLSWETTTQSDIGIDISLFRNRLSFTADAYIKRTRDLLLSVTIPSTSGFSSAIQNLGKVENRGIELTITSYNIDGAFKWKTDFNYALNRNKVLDIGGAPQIFAGGVANIAQNVNSGVIRVGEPLGSFFGYETDGLYQTDEELKVLVDANARKIGDRKYKDLKADGRIDDNDRTIIGRAQPKFIGGINNTFSYKGIDLTVFFQGVYGNQILNANRFELEYLNGTNNQSRDMLNRWTPENTNTDIPRASTTRPANRISTRQIEDGSYLRLKNIQLAYTLPATATKALHLQGVRFYVSAQNYLTWTKYSGYDPEVNRFGQDSRSQGFDYASYPAAKTLIFGLNVGF
ncbi:TonB-dependent receptor P3 [Dyadobacter sp. CECT 9623]|uniref:TonB-dependent receptor P3 n=1 Tax=Dyadobacter linearis TaxID=2823330 RepID=A0ABM8UNN9_9BACT|nr:TonB-dependent receptor [Dyadobacter sp. CECT 9623]CAG5069026.1 TonB-dependent receptor P3 [Dyadobacter sp. CECT 9623]